MDYNAYISKTICEILSQNKSCVLVSMLKSTGSSPRRTGTKMVIDADGKTYGTIGGGLLEASAIRKGIEAHTSGLSLIMDFDMNNIDVNSPEMICGGTVKLLIENIPASIENREFFCKWRDAVIERSQFYLIYVIQAEDERVNKVNHVILFSDGNMINSDMLDQQEIDCIKSEMNNISGPVLLKSGSRLLLIEKNRRIKRLYCFGAGHVAVATARLADRVGFDVVVIDDRKDYASGERFPDAEVRVIEDFSCAFDPDEIDEDSFIAIFTREHRYDRAVLEQAMKTKAFYIGLMASRSKRESIFSVLKEEGFTDSDLARVHSPIGINIKAETSDELAVSIVGELIYERALIK